MARRKSGRDRSILKKLRGLIDGLGGLGIILLFLGSVPFIIWKFRSRSVWPDMSVVSYLMTGIVFLWVKIAYPGPGNVWYWKSVLGVTTLHCIVISLLVAVAVLIDITGVKPPTAMFFLFGTSVTGLEVHVHSKLVARFERKKIS